MTKIASELRNASTKMIGKWIGKKNSYEKECCQILGWTAQDARYHDAYNGTSYIEIKKGQSSMWFNMVRYAEIFLGIGKQSTVTVHFKWTQKPETKIVEVYIIDTKQVIKFLKMTKEKALIIIKLNNGVERQLCMQASATNKDLKKMASHIIKI